MKHLVVLCILFYCSLPMFSQQEYFIYLQTDNSQPFYVRTTTGVYSSSSSGYLILSRLPDTEQSITIGFLKNVFPEQQFNIPVSHKDAGYVLKSNGTGWSLANLQTAASILSSTPAAEKKNPEVTGNKKSDAFALLLSNAVNDTAVLYTIVRPPKPVPVPLVAIAEQKDSTLPQKSISATKDTIAVAKKQSQKKASAALVKNNLQHPKGVAVAARSQKLPAPGIAQNKKVVHDSVTHAKNSSSIPIARNNSIAKKDSASFTRNKGVPGKDTIILGKTAITAAKSKQVTARNNKVRKDTIILMNSKSPAGNKTVAARTREKQLPLRKDTIEVVKKEILQAPEEKRNALQNNKDAVQIEKVPVKPDSSGNYASATTDTMSVISRKETTPPAINNDTVFTAVRRTRPAVNKVAELLTDTSYIAVFVDESNEKFDTIRISVPFNEVLAFSRLQKPAFQVPDNTIENKKDLNSSSIQPLTTNTTAPGQTAAVAAEKLITDTVSRGVEQTTLKADSIVFRKKVKDSSAVSAVPITATVKTDQPILNKIKDSVGVAGSTATDKDTAKQQSVYQQKDTAGVAKAPPALVLPNSDCKEIALDGDIDKLRIKMLVVPSDEDRITLARKVFRQRCFLVKQVRALSELFKSDEGKYKWFDAAYPFISDTGNFPSLSDLLKDDYYLNRFKAMLRH